MILKMKPLLAIATILAVGGAIAQLSSAKADMHHIYAKPVEPELSPALNLGKMNYEAYCASCHGKTARGTGAGPTFISRIYHPAHHGDGAFMVAPRKGVRAHHWQFGDMKPVPGVTDRQLISILGYVRAVQRANGVF